MLTIKAHFDGRALIPDEPLNLSVDQAVILQLETVDRPVRRSFRELIGWALQFPVHSNSRVLTDNELWETGKL